MMQKTQRQQLHGRLCTLFGQESGQSQTSMSG
jgi:hypothetical protein